MDLKRFEEIIKELIPKDLLDEFYDDYGFTNTSNQDIKKIGYATNLSLEVIEKAAMSGVDLIVTHHDAWDFIYGLREACMEKLQAYNISHFYIHGPLDFIEFGTCTSLMKVIDIDNVIQYSTFNETEFPGIGEFKTAVDFEELADKMREELKEPVRAWKNNERAVKRVGILTGAGHASNFIKYAFENGCDTYITGEATLYTIQYAAFIGINLLVGSHTFTEIYGVESLATKIKELNPETEINKLKETHFELNH